MSPVAMATSSQNLIWSCPRRWTSGTTAGGRPSNGTFTASLHGESLEGGSKSGNSGEQSKVTVSADGNIDSKTVPTLMSSSVLQTGKQIQMSRNRLCGFLLVVDSSLLSRGPDDGFSFPKLSGEDNYLSWKQNILLPLRAFQLADALSYEDSVADFSEEKRQKNDNALSAMLVNMEASYQKLYMKHEKAREFAEIRS
ncbi:hypothetical protein V1506DRAFT_390137 [Lipomyces tetrasporus]